MSERNDYEVDSSQLFPWIYYETLCEMLRGRAPGVPRAFTPSPNPVQRFCESSYWWDTPHIGGVYVALFTGSRVKLEGRIHHREIETELLRREIDGEL